MRRPAFLAAVLAAVAFVAAAGCGEEPVAAPTAPPTTGPQPGTSTAAAPAGIAYGGRAELCDRLDLSAARPVVTSITVDDRREHGDPADAHFLECRLKGEGGSTIDDIVVMGVDIEAIVFAEPADAAESYRDLRLDVYIDCPAGPRDLPGLGTRASEAHCPAPDRGYLLNLSDGNLHLRVYTHVSTSGRAPADDAVIALNRALARSVLDVLRVR